MTVLGGRETDMSRGQFSSGRVLLREKEWKKWGSERIKPASGIRISRRHLGKLREFVAFAIVEN